MKFIQKMTYLSLFSLLPFVSSAADGEKVYLKGGDNPMAIACMTCHGVNGEGLALAGYPNIAGKPAEYLSKQIYDFKKEDRKHPVMDGVAAALTDEEIVSITQLIRDIVMNKIGEENAPNVFVKSSTGFFQTPNGEPNGANEHVIKLMLDNAGTLPVKASGGVRNIEEAQKMIDLGVKRIGTSSALAIAKGEQVNGGY